MNFHHIDDIQASEIMGKIEELKRDINEIKDEIEWLKSDEVKEGIDVSCSSCSRNPYYPEKGERKCGDCPDDPRASVEIKRLEKNMKKLEKKLDDEEEDNRVLNPRGRDGIRPGRLRKRRSRGKRRSSHSRRRRRTR